MQDMRMVSGVKKNRVKWKKQERFNPCLENAHCVMKSLLVATKLQILSHARVKNRFLFCTCDSFFTNLRDYFVQIG